MSDVRKPLQHSFGAAEFTPHDLATLRIRRVHFLDDDLLFLLSDGRAVCIPLTISPALAGAAPEDRFQWQLVGSGRGVVWYTHGVEEHINLRAVLTHPEVKLLELPGGLR